MLSTKGKGESDWLSAAAATGYFPQIALVRFTCFLALVQGFLSTGGQYNSVPNATITEPKGCLHGREKYNYCYHRHYSVCCLLTAGRVECDRCHTLTLATVDSDFSGFAQNSTRLTMSAFVRNNTSLSVQYGLKGCKGWDHAGHNRLSYHARMGVVVREANQKEGIVFWVRCFSVH